MFRTDSGRRSSGTESKPKYSLGGIVQCVSNLLYLLQKLRFRDTVDVKLAPLLLLIQSAFNLLHILGQRIVSHENTGLDFIILFCRPEELVLETLLKWVSFFQGGSCLVHIESFAVFVG